MEHQTEQTDKLIIGETPADTVANGQAIGLLVIAQPDPVAPDWQVCLIDGKRHRYCKPGEVFIVVR